MFSSRGHRHGSVVRTALALVLLVLTVGGIAYVTQNLRRGQPAPDGPPAPPEKTAAFLDFVDVMMTGSGPRVMAVWQKQKPAEEKKDDKKEDDGPAPFYFKEFETGTQGHYDFLFRNVSGRDVEIGLYSSSCDCASVHAAVLAADEWQRLRKLHDEKPGEPLPYAAEVAWHALSADPKVQPMPVKAGEQGVIRAKWEARKPAGQELKLAPQVWVQPTNKPGERQFYPFAIPGMMTRPVRVFPQRVSVGTLAAGGTGKAEFDVWTSTREKLDLQFVGALPDPLLNIDAKPLSSKECEDLAAKLNADKDFLKENNKLTTRILSAYHVTVTVYESRDGKQFDQGMFLRKLPLIVDGVHNPELPGPEIIGRALGDIEVGGADDFGKIRFKSFDSKLGATKEIGLGADPKVKLEPYDQHPKTLEVQLTRDEKNSTPERSRWKLKVTVPPNTFAGSFLETDAVILRIAGEPERFVRIGLEGNVGGR